MARCAGVCASVCTWPDWVSTVRGIERRRRPPELEFRLHIATLRLHVGARVEPANSAFERAGEEGCHTPGDGKGWASATDRSWRANLTGKPAALLSGADGDLSIGGHCTVSHIHRSATVGDSGSRCRACAAQSDSEVAAGAKRPGLSNHRPNTTIVGAPGFFSTQKLEGLPAAAAMYCRPPTSVGDDAAAHRAAGVEAV